MAEWDDLGVTKEEYDEAMAGFHDYLDESGHLDPPSDEEIEAMAADMAVAEQPDDHVETPSEYVARIKKEAALFEKMSFDQILKYRIDHKMPLTDSDKRLINDKIVDQYEAMAEEHDGAMEYYDDMVANADYRVDTYANNYEAQRNVAGCCGNVPAWMTHEYPVDDHGRAYTADELRDIYEAQRAENTRAYEAARDKLFARVCDVHEVTTKPDASLSMITKSVGPVIMPKTFSALGEEFGAYHAERIRQRLVDKTGPVNWAKVREDMEAEKHEILYGEPDVKNDSPIMAENGLPVVDFSRSVTSKSEPIQKDVQSELGEQRRQRMADLAIDRQEKQETVAEKREPHGESASSTRGLPGISDSLAASHNRVNGGRSNPDYDFDEYD